MLHRGCRARVRSAAHSFARVAQSVEHSADIGKADSSILSTSIAALNVPKYKGVQ